MEKALSEAQVQVGAIEKHRSRRNRTIKSKTFIDMSSLRKNLPGKDNSLKELDEISKQYLDVSSISYSAISNNSYFQDALSTEPLINGVIHEFKCLNKKIVISMKI